MADGDRPREMNDRMDGPGLDTDLTDADIESNWDTVTLPLLPAPRPHVKQGSPAAGGLSAGGGGLGASLRDRRRQDVCQCWTGAHAGVGGSFCGVERGDLEIIDTQRSWGAPVLLSIRLR